MMHRMQTMVAIEIKFASYMMQAVIQADARGLETGIERGASRVSIFVADGDTPCIQRRL